MCNKCNGALTMRYADLMKSVQYHCLFSWCHLVCSSILGRNATLYHCIPLIVHFLKMYGVIFIHYFAWQYIWFRIIINKVLFLFKSKKCLVQTRYIGSHFILGGHFGFFSFQTCSVNIYYTYFNFRSSIIGEHFQVK